MSSPQGQAIATSRGRNQPELLLARRQFLRLAGLVAGSAAVSACSPIYRRISGLPRPLPAGLDLPPLEPQAFRVLSRLTYGPTAAERRFAAEHGWRGWIEDQLAPERIDNRGLDWRLRQFETLNLEADALVARDREDVVDELKSATTLRRVYSERQLYERMVDFWTDHFNIYIHKGDCWFLKSIDDRQVIRTHALGNFDDLLRASAHSPAMLIYLDNQVNQDRAPNENYARELMELHTLGVEAGYTQQDVMELARCLTGWSVKEHFWRGEFSYKPEIHDGGAKQVLGTHIEPAGQAEAEAVLEQLAHHPATAHFISTKLARRFVADQPPAELVEQAAQAFLASGGSITATLRVVLLEGLEQAGAKLKRPADFVASGLRMLAAETDAGRPIQQLLSQMGQPQFEWPTPDGPPDRSADWTGNLLPRWRFAVDLARNQIQGTQIPIQQLIQTDGPQAAFDRIAALLLGAPLDPTRREPLLEALASETGGDQTTQMQLVLAGLLASPGFQYH